MEKMLFCRSHNLLFILFSAAGTLKLPVWGRRSTNPLRCTHATRPERPRRWKICKTSSNINGWSAVPSPADVGRMTNLRRNTSRYRKGRLQKDARRERGESYDQQNTVGKHQHAVVITTASTHHRLLVSLVPGAGPRQSHSNWPRDYAKPQRAGSG